MQKISNRWFSNKSDRYWLTLIIIAAILPRIAVALLLGNRVIELPGTFDQVSYDMLAQRVIGGYGFTVAELWWPITPAGEATAHWSFLYTLYLATVYTIFGYQPLIARLIQAILAGILMPWLTYRIGRFHFDNSVGLVAAGLSAIYLYFVYYAATLMTETFYIIAILWVLDTAGKSGKTETGQRSLSKYYYQKATVNLGLALTVTILFRQVFLLVVPVLFLWLLWQSYSYQNRSHLKMMGVVAGATAILVVAILPWTYRNYQTFNRFVLLNTNAGYAFYWGNHPIHGYNFIDILPAGGPSYQDLIPAELQGLNEAELDTALLKQSFSIIQSDPIRYVILSVSRTKDYFKFWPSAKSGLVSNISRVFSFGVLMPFMLYGLIINLRRLLSAEYLILYLFMITYTGIHLLTWALIRYRLPVDAVLLIFAATALTKLGRKLFTQNYANL